MLWTVWSDQMAQVDRDIFFLSEAQQPRCTVVAARRGVEGFFGDVLDEDERLDAAREPERRDFSEHGTVDDAARDDGGFVDVLDYLRDRWRRQPRVLVDVFEIDGGVVDGGRQIAVKNMEHVRFVLFDLYEKDAVLPSYSGLHFHIWWRRSTTIITHKSCSSAESEGFRGHIFGDKVNMQAHPEAVCQLFEHIE